MSIGAHFLTCYAVFIANLEIFTKVVCLAIIVLVFFFSFLEKALLCSSQSVVSFTWSQDGTLRLYLKNGESLNVVDIRQRVVLPFMVIIKVDLENRLLSLPLTVFYDSCSQNSFRRLKVLANFSTVKEDT
ncbi:MAG: protein YgfX [Neptuniibacter sp.]